MPTSTATRIESLVALVLIAALVVCLYAALGDWR
jgi:hypothetical protein